MAESKEADFRDSLESDDSGGAKDVVDDFDYVPKGIPRIVEDFTIFCTSEAFGNDLFDFESENCSSFKGADIEGEQSLEWTAIHGEYVELVENVREGDAAHVVWSRQFLSSMQNLCLFVY